MLGKKITVLLKTLLLAYIVTAVLLFISAFIIYKAGFDQSRMRIFVMVIYGVASIVAGVVCGKASGGKRLLNGCLAGIMYFAVLLVISSIANHGFNMDVKKSLISFSICVIGGAVGGIMS